MTSVEDAGVAYAARLRALERQAAQIRDHLVTEVGRDPRVDQITARAKTIDSFVRKAAAKLDDGQPRYVNPAVDIQDAVGVRVVVFYASDVTRVCDRILQDFRPIEVLEKRPVNEAEFTYFGIHHILSCSPDFCSEAGATSVFELQVKTLWQHAWSQAGHDLIYKPGRKVTAEHRRLSAYASASAWGADRVFDQLFRELGDAEDDPS